MDRTVRQQAQVVMQLNRTFGHLTNVWEAQATPEEAPWLGMMTCMPHREHKWDACLEDNKQWGAGTTRMIAKVMKGVAPGQDATERERDKTATMAGGGQKASQHANTTPEERREMRELQQQQPKPELLLRLQPQLQHQPKPKLALAPARRWGTILPWAQSQRAPVGPGQSPGPAPTAGSSMSERSMISRRDESVPPPNKMDQEIAPTIHRAQFAQKALGHIRIMNTNRHSRGIIMAVTDNKATAAMAQIYRSVNITTACTVTKVVIDVRENKSWDRLKIHAVPLVRYMGKGIECLKKMQE